jgi:hypothetical protein
MLNRRIILPAGQADESRIHVFHCVSTRANLTAAIPLVEPLCHGTMFAKPGKRLRGDRFQEKALPHGVHVGDLPPLPLIG